MSLVLGVLASLQKRFNIREPAEDILVKQNSTRYPSGMYPLAKFSLDSS